MGVHAAGRREGQPSVEFRPDAPASRSSRRTATARAGRSTSPTRRASSRGSASPGGRAIAGSCAAATGSRSTWKARAPTCGCRSTRRSSSSRPCSYDATTGPGTLATGFAELRPLDQPSGQVRAWDPNLRPQFTQQWNVFAEYLLTPSMSANVGYVGHNADHLVTPVEGNQPLPGVGRSVDLGCRCRQRRPLYATAPLITNISTTAARGRSDYNALQVSLRQRIMQGLEYLASYTLGTVTHQQPRLLRLGRRRRGGRLLDEHLRAGVELRAGVLRRPAQLRVLGELRAAVRPRTHVWAATSRRSSTRSSAAGG